MVGFLFVLMLALFAVGQPVLAFCCIIALLTWSPR